MLTVSKRLNQKGFTVIELLVVIVIIGILAFAMYSLLFSKGGAAKIVSAEKMVFDIYSSAQEWKTRQGSLSYTGISMGALSTTLPGFNANISNPWGVVPGFSIAPSGTNIAISTLGVPTEDQTSLQNRFTGMGYVATVSGGNIVVTLP